MHEVTEICRKALIHGEDEFVIQDDDVIRRVNICRRTYIYHFDPPLIVFKENINIFDLNLVNPRSISRPHRGFRHELFYRPKYEKTFRNYCRCFKWWFRYNYFSIVVYKVIQCKVSESFCSTFQSVLLYTKKNSVFLNWFLLHRIVFSKEYLDISSILYICTIFLLFDQI